MKHDEFISETFCNILCVPHSCIEDSLARHIITLPGRLGGLGLRCATRICQGGFLASWIDALQVCCDKLPAVTRRISACLMGPTLLDESVLSEV